MVRVWLPVEGLLQTACHTDTGLIGGFGRASSALFTGSGVGSEFLAGMLGPLFTDSTIGSGHGIIYLG